MNFVIRLVGILKLKSSILVTQLCVHDMQFFLFLLFCFENGQCHLHFWGLMSNLYFTYIHFKMKSFNRLFSFE
jgi:hypothetical protein